MRLSPVSRDSLVLHEEVRDRFSYPESSIDATFFNLLPR